nr:HK97 gp10 family phage protein [Clostridium botulinum]
MDTSDLDDFAKDLLKLASSELPKKSKTFMQKEGNKLKKATLKRAKSNVIEDTGEYFKGIKRGKVYKYGGKQGNTSIRVYGGYVAHLLEYGHRQVTHKKQGHKEVGFVPGFHVFEKSAKEFESTFNSDCEEFVENTVIKELSE